MIVITFQLNTCDSDCLSIIPGQSFIDIQSIAVSVAAPRAAGLESWGLRSCQIDLHRPSELRDASPGQPSDQALQPSLRSLGDKMLPPRSGSLACGEGDAGWEY